MSANLYDEFPYRCLPIEWTAPERMALASRLHGGPLTKLEGCRVLELGCGDGGNLLPMAWHRRHSTFVGVDAAGTQVDVARRRAARLGLTNVDLLHADVRDSDARLDGQFDYIVAHGLCSWVPADALQALFTLCASRLAPSGLLYLNYNA
ncbi:methyltransferase, partial [Rubrivivax gelatinosus]|nr:methyltransferase [Rubrivivax gelatinosus]